MFSFGSIFNVFTNHLHAAYNCHLNEYCTVLFSTLFQLLQHEADSTYGNDYISFISTDGKTLTIIFRLMSGPSLM